MKSLVTLMTAVIVVSTTVCNAQWEKIDGPDLTGVIKMAKLNGNLYASSYIHLYKSTDNGTSWNLIYSWNSPEKLKDLVAHDGGLIMLTNSRLIVSEDEGLSWREVTFFDDYDLFLLPAEPVEFVHGQAQESRIYVRTRDFKYLFYTKDLFRTLDGYALNMPGWNFKLDLNRLYSYNSKAFFTARIQPNSPVDTVRFPEWIRCMSVDLNEVAIGSNDGVHISQDYGRTFTHILGVNAAIGITCFDNEYVYAVHSSKNRIYRIKRATLALDSVSVADLWLPENSPVFNGIVELTRCTVVDDILYVIPGQHGINRSTDHGLTWTRPNTGFNDATAYDFCTFGSTMIVPAERTVWMTDDASTWTQVDFGAEPFSAMACATNQSQIYLFHYADAITRSDDNGQTWTRLPTPTPNSGFAKHRVLANDTYVYGVEQGVYRSSDSGKSWTACNTGSIGWMAIDQGELFTGHKDGFAWSTDDGDTWETVSVPPAPPNGNSVIRIFAVAGNIILGGNNDDVWRSTDRGRTWALIYTAPNRLTLNHILAYGGAFVAVFYGDPCRMLVTHDNGDTWEDFWPDMYDGTFGLHVFKDYLYAGTDQDGIWRRPVSQVLPVKEAEAAPADISLSQNYPNPVPGGSITSIRFTMPHAGYVTLAVTNTLGTEVARLINNERTNAGANLVQFNTADLPAGTYFYSLRTGTATIVKSFVITR